MKVLQMNAVYGIGSTGHIVQDIHLQLKRQGHESYVCWATGCSTSEQDDHLLRIGTTVDHKIHAILHRIGHDQGFHSKRATKKFCKTIDNIQPDIVHLHNLHSNYIHLPTLLEYLADKQIRTLVTLHDCWFFTGQCTYYQNYSCDGWKTGCHNCRAINKCVQSKVVKLYLLKKELFNRSRLAINGVSKWTTQAAKVSILSNARLHRCIYNWVDTNVFYPRNNREETRRKHQIPDDAKLILGVSQGWSERKGLLEFYEIAERLGEKAFVLLVGEGKQVQSKHNLKCIGFTDSRQELIDLYSAADVFINPSRMETFGLVTVEAMACGTPVIAYNNTGSSEIVSKDCGVLVEDGNIQELVNETELFLQKDISAIRKKCREYVLNHFNKTNQIQEYIDLYVNMIQIL